MLDLIKVNSQVRAPQVHTTTNTYVVVDCLYPGQRRVLFSEALKPEPSKATTDSNDPMISEESVDRKQPPEQKDENGAMEIEPPTLAELRPRYCGHPEWQMLAATAADNEALLQYYRFCSSRHCVSLSSSELPVPTLFPSVSWGCLALELKVLRETDGVCLSPAHCEDKGELQRRLRDMLPPPPPVACVEAHKDQPSTDHEQTSKMETGGHDLLRVCFALSSFVLFDICLLSSLSVARISQWKSLGKKRKRSQTRRARKRKRSNTKNRHSRTQPSKVWLPNVCP